MGLNAGQIAFAVRRLSYLNTPMESLMLKTLNPLIRKLPAALKSPPRRRRGHTAISDSGALYASESLEKRTMLSSISVSGDVLEYNADVGEMNRVSIRPINNGSSWKITEETRVYRNQVPPFDPLTPEPAVSISVDPSTLNGLECEEMVDSQGNVHVIVHDPDRTINEIIVNAGDENDVVKVHTRRIDGSTEYVPVTVNGEEGNDALITGWGSDAVYGGPGHDYIFTNSGDDYQWGGPGHDKMLGGRGNDVMRGGAGTDVMYGGADDDELYGQQNHDRLHGQGGDDFIDGGPGADHLTGGPGTDVMFGGHGSDLFMAQWGRAGRNDQDKMFGFRDDDGDNVQDPGDMHNDVVNVKQADDSHQGIDETFASLRRQHYVFNTGNMYFWNGLRNLPKRSEWRSWSAADKWQYWVGLRQNWNMDWDVTHRRFYSTTVRF